MPSTTTQPQNSNQNPVPPASGSLRNRLLIIAGIALVCGLLILLQLNNRSTKNPSDRGSYYDTGSGETVSNPDDKSPENLGTLGDLPLFLGLSKLLEQGVTQDQLDGLKLAFSKYPVLQDSKSIREVSVSIDSIKVIPHDSEDPVQSLTFDTTINRQSKLVATVEYSGLSDVRLVLSSRQGTKTEFDSGWIGSKEVDELNDIGD